MKKIISTIVAITLVSSMLTTTAFAGDRRGDILNPLWVPVAILSTIAAAVTFSEPTVIHERRVVYEQPRTVIYEEPPRFRHDNRHNRYYANHDRGYERHRHYDYR